MTDRTPHVLVATPCYNGMTTGHFTQSMVGLASVMRAAGMEMSFSCLFNESLIQRARNALAHAFMQDAAYTHLMFIDADIQFRPQDVVSMVAADREILCGLYPKKEIHWPRVAAAVQQGVPPLALFRHTGSMVVELVKPIAGPKESITVPVNEPLEIRHGGTGFMLIQRRVMEQLRPKVNRYLNDHAPGMEADPNDLVSEYFSVTIDPETRRLLSEDFAFCGLARAQGIRVWAAPWVRLGHFGNYLFEGGLVPPP